MIALPGALCIAQGDVRIADPDDLGIVPPFCRLRNGLKHLVEDGPQSRTFPARQIVMACLEQDKPGGALPVLDPLAVVVGKEDNAEQIRPRRFEVFEQEPGRLIVSSTSQELFMI